ncbi:MAG: TorF family putative porin [Alphaproteobacteria bacterium]
MFKATKNLALAGAFLVAGLTAASAADLYVPVSPVPPVAAPSKFDLAFGATVTSDYIARGISQTMGGPAVQATLEASYGILYAGAFVSNVNFAGVTGTEIDVGAGIRPTWGPATFDLGYVQYLYTNGAAATFGEVYGKVDVQIADPFSVGASVFYNPFGNTIYGEGRASLDIFRNWQVVSTTLSGAVGYQTGAANYVTWNAGVSFTYHDWATLDLRYHGSNLTGAGCTAMSGAATNCGHRFMAALTLKTTLSALRGM